MTMNLAIASMLNVTARECSGVLSSADFVMMTFMNRCQLPVSESVQSALLPKLG